MSVTGMKQGRRVRGGDEGVERVRNPVGAGRSGEAIPAAAAAMFLKRCRGGNLMRGSPERRFAVLAPRDDEPALWTGSSLKEK
jgi:hypothetical protein